MLNYGCKFRNENTTCRLCNNAEETYIHIVNCDQLHVLSEDEIGNVFGEEVELNLADVICSRIVKFMDRVSTQSINKINCFKLSNEAINIDGKSINKLFCARECY